MAEWIPTKSADFEYLPTEDEISVSARIAEHSDESFDDFFNRDTHFGEFFHLSPMRESILNWYPFDSNASTLEIGGDMGALTGLLCRKCARVMTTETKTYKAKAILARYSHTDNLTVVNGNVPEGMLFDYIVALDPVRIDTDYLTGLYMLLKPHGRLLLAVENRFALRYWCGKRSRETGLPFDSLFGRGGLMSKAELSQQLSKTGFMGQKWYYPLTDHWFARDIYSEAKLPNRFLNTRFHGYIMDDSTLIMNETALYDGIICGGAFEFMCNAYLIEARKCGDDAACDVDYAALTTYRTSEKRFATTVCSNGEAIKTALHADGISSLKKMAENHSALSKRGINTVPVTLSGSSAVMPCIQHETLWDYWQSKIKMKSLDTGEFIKMFDRLRDVIMQSSDCDPPGSYGWDKSLGAVQKIAYPELIPANCFYDPKDDELIFFDQEFSREHCPASVPLYRALLCFQAESFYSDECMRKLYPVMVERYGLTGCLPILQDIDTKFGDYIFNYDATAALTRMASVAGGIATGNIMLLESAQLVSNIVSRWKKVGIYGYGRRGRAFYDALRMRGVEAVFIIDKNADCIAEAKSEPMETQFFAKLADVPKTLAFEAIIVTPKADADAVAGTLRAMTTRTVITLDEVLRIDLR